MTSEDELRAKLAVASCDDLHRFNVVPGVACTDCQRHADALLPVIRAHSADAWDHGHRTANPVIPDTHRDVINPWKQP